ncbi:MAG TPA: hypothetical protein VK892_21940 [Pyrinomonadaceae bacterium]|nr:hypothetical protein [Pyrinomonadaceae bacterium]
MKICPNCQNKYTDDTLQFCLQDGTPLVNSQSRISGFDDADDAETRVRNSQEPMHFDLRDSQRNLPPQVVPIPSQTKESSSILVVLLTTLITILLFGGGIAAWFYLKNGKNESAQKANPSAQNRRTVNANLDANTNAAIFPLPENSEKPNSKSKEEPISPPPNFNPEEERENVKDTINSWKSLTESRNIAGYMRSYADRVDYYRSSNASRDFVRQDKERAFADFDSIDIDINNLQVTFGSDGATAIAEFDKKWEFEGEEKYSAGKVRQQLQLRKVGNQWLITGERDLRVYYVE